MRHSTRNANVVTNQVSLNAYYRFCAPDIYKVGLLLNDMSPPTLVIEIFGVRVRLGD